MKRDRVLSLAVTQEEYQAILNLVHSEEIKKGNRITVSDFLRSKLTAYFDNNSSPPQETPKETITDDVPDVKQDNEWDIKL